MVAMLPTPADEPVWIGTEAVMVVRLNDPELAPANEPSSPDRKDVRPLDLRAVNKISTDAAANSCTYEIRYVGLRRGEYDLRDYLKFSPNFNRQMFAPIIVNIADPLPPNHDGELETPPVLERRMSASSLRQGHIAAMAVIWLAGLAIVLLVPWILRRSRRLYVPAGTPEDPLLKQLRLAEVRMLTPPATAEIERNLLERWRIELNLKGGQGVTLIRAIQKDERGRELLDALEAWRAELESRPALMPQALKAWAEAVQKPVEVKTP
jgi:hypothetical protein